MSWSDISIYSQDVVTKKDPRERFQKQNGPGINVKDEGKNSSKVLTTRVSKEVDLE